MVFRLPLAILGCAIAGSLSVLCARVLAGPGKELSIAALASSRIAPLCMMAYAYIRWVYVARTRLVISSDGISLHQPLASWIVPWPEISTIVEAGPLNPTHRGGISAAAILFLRSGGRRSIPDIFDISRNELTARLVRDARLNNR